MLVFSDVAKSKRFESIAPMADGSVEIAKVDGCLKGHILKVDVATDTDYLVTQVDQACCTDDLILQVDATCDCNIWPIYKLNYTTTKQVEATSNDCTRAKQGEARPNDTVDQGSEEEKEPNCVDRT